MSGWSRTLALLNVCRHHTLDVRVNQTACRAGQLVDLGVGELVSGRADDRRPGRWYAPLESSGRRSAEGSLSFVSTSRCIRTVRRRNPWVRTVGFRCHH